MYKVKNNPFSFFMALSSLLLLTSCQDQPQEPSLSAVAADVTIASAKRVGVPKTFVLVPGAWHPASCYGELANLLAKAGHKVKTVELPGLGNDLTPIETISLASHVEAVEKVIASTSGKVVLVGHSYGGVLISQVGERMPEKIEKLVYLAAFMLENGQSLYDIAIGDTNSLVVQNLFIDGPVANIAPTQYVPAFYNYSLSHPNPLLTLKVEEMCKKLRPHPAATLVTPVMLSARYEALPKIYITTAYDKAVTPATQKKMVANHPRTLTYKLLSDHSPFISQPKQLSTLLLTITKENLQRK